jgi:hypothetical protein
LRYLKELRLGNGSVDRKFIDILSRFKNLEVLELPIGVRLTKSEERKLQQALPRLKLLM